MGPRLARTTGPGSVHGCANRAHRRSTAGASCTHPDRPQGWAPRSSRGRTARESLGRPSDERANSRRPHGLDPSCALDGRLIGTVNFDVDAETRTAMLGYALGRSWWGRGIATEAVRAATAWAIEAFGLTRIWASTDARNVRSQRVLQKLGMQCETLRVGDHVGRDGRLADEVVYGLNLTP